MATFLEQIEAFCAAHEISESRFGLDALNDKNFIANLRDNRSPTLKTAEKVRSFMASYEPERAA